MCSCERVAAEFTLQKLGLNHDRPTDFIKSSWPCIPPRLFSAYRIILACGLLIWLVTDCVYETLTYYVQSSNQGSWFLFATNWSFMLLTAAFIALAIMTLRHCCDKTGYETRVHGYQVAWLLYSVGIASVCVSCITYWLSQSAFSHLNYFTSTASKVKHSLTMTLVLVDLMLGAVPSNIFHLVYVAAAGVLYILFSLVFALAKGVGPGGGTNIYPQIVWNKDVGASVSASLLVLLGSVVIHCLIFTLALLRHFVLVDLCGYPEPGALGAGAADSTHEEAGPILAGPSGERDVNRDASYASLKDNDNLPLESH